MEQKVINDLGKFYSHKLHKLTVDIIDSCERMDLPSKETAVMIVSVLASELMHFAVAIEMEEEDFVGLCTDGFRKFSK